jgi:malate synthase
MPPRKKGQRRPSLKEQTRDVLSTIRQQIKAAEDDLLAYRPNTVDWYQRAIATAESLIPWLMDIVPDMRNFVQDVLNAPARLRQMWMNIREHVDLPTGQIEAFYRQLSLDDVLRESVTGEVVSNIVTKHLLENHSALASNGRSDYPDVFLTTHDYTALPVFKKKKTVTPADEYGAAPRGAAPCRAVQ